MTAGVFEGGAVGRPRGERLRRVAVAAALFLLGVLVMFLITELAFRIGVHHRRNKGEILVGMLVASVPICVFMYFSLSEALVALPKLLRELTWWDLLWGSAIRQLSRLSASGPPAKVIRIRSIPQPHLEF